ncbi:hypothetical protein M0802_015136 [Mischocyttarus mexicanus]|nr:hypothetical protein M0802_015136 [Mischocyttarus mexicanus]
MRRSVLQNREDSITDFFLSAELLTDSSGSSLPGNGLHVLFPETAQNGIVTLLPPFGIVVPTIAALRLALQLWLRDMMFCHGLLFAIPRPGIHPEHQLAPPRGKTMA